MSRPTITRETLDLTLELLKAKMYARLAEKGYGSFASTHEISGIVTEEYTEFLDTVRSNDMSSMEEELLDLAIGCVFGVACINQNTLEW